MGNSGKTVAEHQDIFAAIAKVLGDQVGQISSFEAQYRRNIGRCCDDHRFGQTLLSKSVLNKFLNFATALSDQTNNHNIGFGVARQHAKQNTFANARAGHQANALTLT